MTWRWLAILVLAGCISPVMTFGGGKTRTQAQHDTLDTLRPGRLAMVHRWSGPVADAKIRVYADEEYRTQNRAWRQTFDERLDYANAVLGATFGVHLVADYREWNHNAPGATLAEHLEELQRLDDGDSVLAVVGLTSSQSLVTATFEQLGLATLSGRHMMLRGYADLEERKSFANAFDDLSADERESALVTIRFHKTTSVFLHELGHNLGADHDSIPDTIMNATYSRNATTFSEGARATIQRTLDERLGRASSEAPRTASPATPPETSRGTSHAGPHPKMQVVVLLDGAIVDGTTRDDGELDKLFGAQAAIDSETEVTISKQKGVPSTTVAAVMARMKATGLKNISFH